MSSALEDRFWSKVRKTSSCWIWTGTRFKQGYGLFRFEGKLQKAHRVAWFLTYGYWPTPCALHECDNRPCCRPDHLFEGTQLDNIEDMVRKGRHPRKSNHGKAILNERKVIQLRKEKETSPTILGKKYGISPRQVVRIRSGEHWKNA